MASDFEEFYHAGYGRLVAQVCAYLGDAAEAEDVVQEAYLRAWRRWDTVDGYADPIGWVRKVAWNLATSRLRRVTVALRGRRLLPDRREAPALNADHVVLVAALRQIPERQRLALVLHYLVDLSVADIAEQTGASVNTVLSWLRRGRIQLARRLGVDDPGEPTFDQPRTGLGAIRS